MKRKLIYIAIILLIPLYILINKGNKESINTIRLGEVTHSAFYTPLYVAINKGYFEDENLDIKLSMISGANNITSALLADDIDIGLCGPEALIYVYNSGEKDYVKAFSGLTKRDGQFLVGRKKEYNFKWKNLSGKEVLAGRVGGMPELNFENALKKAGVNNVKINTSVDFASLSSAFISGEGDYVNLFEPNATKMEEMGEGYVITSIGEKSGEMPYTTFNARKSYINKNPKVIKKFRKAIRKGLKFTKENDASTIADVIIKSFPEISKSTLTKIIDRYKKADSWLDNTDIDRKLFENLEDIMIDSNQIKARVPFNNIVTNK